MTRGDIMSRLDIFSSSMLAKKVVLDMEKSNVESIENEITFNGKKELYPLALSVSTLVATIECANAQIFMYNGYNYKNFFLTMAGLGVAAAILNSDDCRREGKVLRYKLKRAKKYQQKAQEAYEEFEFLDI